VTDVPPLVVPRKGFPGPTSPTDLNTDWLAIETWAKQVVAIIDNLPSGGGGITEITSTGGTIAVTDPTGPTVNIEAGTATLNPLVQTSPDATVTNTLEATGTPTDHSLFEQTATEGTITTSNTIAVNQTPGLVTSIGTVTDTSIPSTGTWQLLSDSGEAGLSLSGVDSTIAIGAGTEAQLSAQTFAVSSSVAYIYIGVGSPDGILTPATGNTWYFDVNGDITTPAIWLTAGGGTTWVPLIVPGYLGITTGTPSTTPPAGSMMSDTDGSLWVYTGASWNHIT